MFAHDAHLVVATGNGEHVADLAPADFPERYVPLLVKSDYLRLCPPLVLILAVAFRSPHFACSIFRAACDHFVHQPDVRAPGHVSYPVIMRADFD